MTNYIVLTKDGQFWRLRDPAHVAAFLAAGWKIAEEKPAAAEPVVKPRKPRAKRKG